MLVLFGVLGFNLCTNLQRMKQTYVNNYLGLEVTIMLTRRTPLICSSETTALPSPRLKLTWIENRMQERKIRTYKYKM